MHWSRGSHALITWLRMHWSRNHMHWPRGYHALMTWLIMHWSCDWSCTDHVVILHWSLGWSYTHHGTHHALITVPSCIDYMTPHALITWMIVHWSRDWSGTDHVTDHALISWLSCIHYLAIVHWSRGWLYTDTRLIMHWSGLYHTLITWLPMHWSRGWSYTDHVTDHAVITPNDGATENKREYLSYFLYEPVTPTLSLKVFIHFFMIVCTDLPKVI